MTHSRTKVGRRFNLAILGALLAAAVSLLIAGPASAQSYIPHEFEKSFNGSTSPGGPFEGSAYDVGVDQQTGSVYVLTTQTGLKLYKFDAQGEPSPFTDPSLGGSNVITVGATEYFTFTGLAMAVDNSGGPTRAGSTSRTRASTKRSGPTNPAELPSAAITRCNSRPRTLR